MTTLITYITAHPFQAVGILLLAVVAVRVAFPLAKLIVAFTGMAIAGLVLGAAYIIERIIRGGPK